MKAHQREMQTPKPSKGTVWAYAGLLNRWILTGFFLFQVKRISAISPQIQQELREGKHSQGALFLLPAIHSRPNWQAKPSNGSLPMHPPYPPHTSPPPTLPTGPRCCWANQERFCLLNSGTSFSTLAPFISPNNPPKNLTGGQTHSTWVMMGAPWLSVWIFTLSSKEGHAYKSTPALPSSGSGFGSAGVEARKTASEYSSDLRAYGMWWSFKHMEYGRKLAWFVTPQAHRGCLKCQIHE